MNPEKLNSPGIVKIAKRLEDGLAQTIKEREEKIVKDTREHAKMQGEDLLRVKHHLGKRKFAPWLEANAPFSRPTAYKYMRIARNWDLICKGPLQMQTLEEVHRELFGTAKKQSKSSSSAEAESTADAPGSSRSKENEPNTVTVRVERIEAASDHPGVAADESTALYVFK